MTIPLIGSPVTHGEAAAPTLTPLSATLTPSQFTAECRRIVAEAAGDDAHRQLDRLVTRLLSSLGFGEGMAVFIATVRRAHDEEGAADKPAESAPPAD